jgi:hypothetical protein
MSVSAVSSGVSSCESSDFAEVARVVLVAKKQQDVQKSEAQALLNLMKQSVDGVGQRINVLA